jgi:hypothetical protein
MTDPQRQRNTAEHWFLRILVAIGVPAVVFLVLKWTGQAEFAIEGAIVSACGIITVVILSPILRARRRKTG